jgi:hypothetical protein
MEEILPQGVKVGEEGWGKIRKDGSLLQAWRTRPSATASAITCHHRSPTQPRSGLHVAPLLSRNRECDREVPHAADQFSSCGRVGTPGGFSYRRNPLFLSLV